MMKLSGRIVTVDRTPILAGRETLSGLDRFIRAKHLGRGGVFILADVNTRRDCLPYASLRSAAVSGAVLLEIESGEKVKTLETAGRLWKELMAAGAVRDSLLINLGGGVVSDLGGFVAAGFKRGISYINIPTSLIGQCDAAIGGKTSVNLDGLKNQVGFFSLPAGVFIDTGLLATLPADHLRSGLGEIIKSALVGDDILWRRMVKHPVDELAALPLEHPFWQEMITGAVRFKNSVVVRDYREQKLRKALNFGHTIGHALESFSGMGAGRQLLHGEAVAAGMIGALWLSHLKTGLQPATLQLVKSYLVAGFGRYAFDRSARKAIMEIMAQDKKNSAGYRFTLISAPGQPVTGVSCTPEEIDRALDFYLE